MNRSKELKKNHISEYPLTFIVIAFLLVMFFGYIFEKQQDFSDVENRYLQKMPAITMAGLSDGSFMENFETYTCEQLPLRTGFIKIKTLCDTAVGKIENHGIAKGKDGYLFDKSTADTSQFSTNLKLIDKFVSEGSSHVYVAFAPTSVAINDDRLPKGLPVLDEKSLNEMAREEFSDNDNASFIDLFDVMEDHKDEDIYYRTDHHWKSIGAYYAYERIIDVMSTKETPAAKTTGENSELSGTGMEKVDITKLTKHTADDFFGTFYAKYQVPGETGDSIEYYDTQKLTYTADDEEHDSLYDESKLEIYDKYAMFMYGNFGRATVKNESIENDDSDGFARTLIIFKDSYANCLIPFLTYNYDKIEIADLRYMGGSVSDFLSANPDADILMMYNYSFLNEDNHFYKLLK